MGKSLSTLRRRADAIGLKIEKGYVHYMSYGGAVFQDMNGKRKVGYSVFDCTTGYYIWPSYNDVFDHQFSLEDVEKYLSDEYQERGMKF